MGTNQSNQATHECQETRNVMTFDQLLYKTSQKVDKLQEILQNMKKERTKKERLSDHEARSYLADILRTAEGELNHLNLSLGRPVQQRDRDKQYDHERLRYPEHHVMSQEQLTGTPRETPRSPYIDKIQKQLENSIAELSSAQKSLEEVRIENKALKTTVDEQAKRSEEHKKEIHKLRDENRILLQRLSKLTSDKLTADNPNIADLSDPNRPTKLVEMMSELYDNQWTDAFMALQPLKNDDRLVVKILLHTFMDIYCFCKEKSTSLVLLTEKSVKDLFDGFNETLKKMDRITKTKSATLLCRPNGKENLGLLKEHSFDESNIVFLDWQDKEAESELEENGNFKMVKDVWPKLEGELKKVRKDFGAAMVPIVTKAYLKPRWRKSCVKALKPYIKRCVDVAWMMCVQTPPMALATLPRQGDKFDVNMYSPYSKRGHSIDFVVWPAVLLKEQQFAENPLVMRKGVADGTDIKYTDVSKRKD